MSKDFNAERRMVLADATKTPAEKTALFSMIAAEERTAYAEAHATGNAREYVPAAHLKAYASPEAQAVVAKTAPKVFGALIAEWRNVQATKDFANAPLIAYAQVKGGGFDVFGKEIKPRYAFLTLTPRLIVEGKKDLSTFNPEGQVGKGGTFGEWLYALITDYQKDFGEYVFPNAPKLVKAAKA